MGGGPHGGSKPETKGTGQAEACPARSAIASLQRGISTDCALRRNCALVFSGCYTRPRHLPRPRQSSAERRERANKLRCRWEAGVLKLEDSREGSSRPPHALDDERQKTARSSLWLPTDEGRLTVYAKTPPCAEHEITDKARALCPTMEALAT